MKNLFLLSVIVFMFSSCVTYAPITEKIITQNQWKEEDLKKIQFYTSHEIQLYRQAVQGSTTIVHGEIKIVNGKEVEMITIPRRTPGVLTFLNDGRFAVTFEEGETYYLMFGAVQSKGGRYLLLASDWKEDIGEITYGNEKYFTDVNSSRCLLLVDMKKINKENINERTVKGVKID